MTRRRLAGTYATALYSGDPVQPATSTATGYIVQGSASTTVFPSTSWEMTTQQGAGNHSLVWRTSHVATCRGSRLALASRTASTRA